MNLKELPIGQNAIITAVGGEGGLRQHFLDMGLIAGNEVRVQKLAPMGDPMEVRIHGYALTLRLAEAEQIEVSPITDDTPTAPQSPSLHDQDEAYHNSLHDHYAHPGIGEAGKYHDKTHENPLPPDTQLSIALVGQPNCGKTTLFNQLTGAKQHVGNFPGVTVDRKDGTIRNHPNTTVTDLPGIYSLSPYSIEEIVSREFIVRQHPHCIINIVDAGNIERSLYMTLQLIEMGIPMVLAVNMIDELHKNGGSLRLNRMESLLGIPVVPISAMKNEGIDELVEHVLHVAVFQEAPARVDFCSDDEKGRAILQCLHDTQQIIENNASQIGIPLRLATAKVIEGDQRMIDELNLDADQHQQIEQHIQQMESAVGLDRSAAIADMRYSFIDRFCQQTVVKPRESREYRRSQKIDRVLTGRWTALPIFALVMVLIIYLSIDLLGAPLQEWLDQGITALATWCDGAMQRCDTNVAIRSLVVDGIFGGVGSVLSFVPIIILLFFFLSILEDSGYMARVAFIADRTFRRIGLSGRSIVPLLIGFGCSVPAVMASRTLPSGRDRRLTIMLTPFMSCSAKIPIYGFFTAAFFPRHAAIILIGLYLLGIITGIAYAFVIKLTNRGGEAAPFVMELPNYRIPALKNMMHLLWDKVKDFVSRAFTVIFIATIIIWFLQSFNFSLQMVENGDGSMLSVIGGVLAPLFKPIGLGSWQIVTALITGFIAKESVVSTLKVLNPVLNPVFTTASALSMLVFCLIYTPCVAAIAAVRREIGGKGAATIVLMQCLIAYLVAGITYVIANAII
ncbi:MAG: ferrous iron transport protein B [Bacteroidales bacterium]|nr:ferrous iron transport protein B [Bacteroidales bacterium]